MADTKIHNWRELNLQSLDRLLCVGHSKFSRYIYKTQKIVGYSEEESRITHVAGVDVCEYDETLHVQESTTLNEFSGKKGVQINGFEPWIDNYNGEVYVKKLDFTRNAEFYKIEDSFWLKHKDDPYESGIPGGFELLMCVLGVHRYIPYYTPMSTKELHCSDEYAMRVDAHCLWEKRIFPNRMPPAMWLNTVDEIQRCDVSELIRIK